MNQQVENIIGVRFSKVGKIYHFDGSHLQDLKMGDAVIVETSRGLQLGFVAQITNKTKEIPEGGIKPIQRRATPRDLLLRQGWQQKEEEAVSVCKSRSIEIRLSGIKIISAEYSFDGSRLTFFFSTENEDGRADLKSLRSDMQKQYSPATVEMRQVGPRDVAKILGGMGACGLENRCCAQFLTDFSSISIKMAKEQNISLTPAEITGMCGRLRCCLGYEYETYTEARQRLPRRKARVKTPLGEGKVIDVAPLREVIFVEIPEMGMREFPVSDIQILDSAEQTGIKPPCQNCKKTDNSEEGKSE
jgi:cell fate regulator YaaT (PSP1 superfamily)